MTALAPARVGWCPGALRPMASGDGLILRVKPRGARLTLAQARRIAEVSRREGNGALDLTSRANLQIRGVGEATLDAALAGLDAAGLIDRDPETEALRNIVSSPLAGFDPRAVLDIRRALAGLEERLAEDPALRALPAKFSVLVDDGGRPALDDVPADIRFKAFWEDGAAAFAIGVGGEKAVGACRPEDLPDVATALSRVFIAAFRADPEIRRMSHLVRRDGAEAVLRRAGLQARRPSPHRGGGGPATAVTGIFSLAATGSTPLSHQPVMASASEAIQAERAVWLDCRVASLLAMTASTMASVRGVKAIVPAGGSEARATVLGVSAPFGRMTAAQLETLTGAAEAAGGTELRLTPWRSVLIPGLAAATALKAQALCAEAGLIVDAADPRLAVAACSGAPGCHRGSTPVLDHAARLAGAMSAPTRPGGIALHVSGCRKGCAHAGQAPITLVGHDGLYDVVFDGGAQDAPTLRDLSFEEAERCLRPSSVGTHP